MPVHQSYPYDARLFPRQPSMLRRVGEAIISWADRRETAYAERSERARRATPVPAYLRRDVGLPPLSNRLSDRDRW